VIVYQKPTLDKRLYSAMPPVYSNLEIPAGQYTDLDGNVIHDGVRLKDCSFDVITRTKHYSNKCHGKAGTIKQFIADGDYINVQPYLYEKP
jgi:hypothetical protein